MYEEIVELLLIIILAYICLHVTFKILVFRHFGIYVNIMSGLKYTIHGGGTKPKTKIKQVKKVVKKQEESTGFFSGITKGFKKYTKRAKESMSNVGNKIAAKANEAFKELWKALQNMQPFLNYYGRDLDDDYNKAMSSIIREVVGDKIKEETLLAIAKLLGATSVVTMGMQLASLIAKHDELAAEAEQFMKDVVPMLTAKLSNPANIKNIVQGHLNDLKVILQKGLDENWITTEEFVNVVKEFIKGGANLQTMITLFINAMQLASKKLDNQ